MKREEEFLTTGVEAPTSKLQAPVKFQTPNAKLGNEIGARVLELGAFPLIRGCKKPAGQYPMADTHLRAYVPV